MNLKCVSFLAASALLLSGCTSTSTSSDMAVIRLTEGGSQVRILNSEATTESCVKLGEVKAYPPYVLPDDARNTLRNKASELGADAIYVTNYLIAPATANAYRCQNPTASRTAKRHQRN